MALVSSGELLESYSYQLLSLSWFALTAKTDNQWIVRPLRMVVFMSQQRSVFVIVPDRHTANSGCRPSPVVHTPRQACTTPPDD